MNETNGPVPETGFAADEPFFKALLTPHRSLGRAGFMILMGALVFGWAVTGIFMLSHGAWPVFHQFGVTFFTSTDWDVVNGQFGAGTAIFGTLVTSAIALLLATPLAIGVAIFLTEFAPK